MYDHKCQYLNVGSFHEKLIEQLYILIINSLKQKKGSTFKDKISNMYFPFFIIPYNQIKLNKYISNQIKLNKYILNQIKLNDYLLNHFKQNEY